MGITLEGDSDEAIKFGQHHNSHGIPVMPLVVSVNDDKNAPHVKKILHHHSSTILP